MYRLRKLELSDAPLMLEWMHDKNVNSVFETPFSSFTIEKVNDFILSSFSEDYVHFACVDCNDEYLGTVSLKHIDRKNKSAEYAISFRSKAHGQGASAFATREILNYAFDKMGLERVFLCYLDINKRAEKFYKKSGFVYEGTARKAMLYRNELHDLNYMSILKCEWEGMCTRDDC